MTKLSAISIAFGCATILVAQQPVQQGPVAGNAQAWLVNPTQLGGSPLINSLPVSAFPTWALAAPGLLPQRGELMEGTYGANLPTVQAGQAVPLQTDGAGRLVVGSVYSLPPITLNPLPRALPVAVLPDVGYPSYSASGGITLASSSTDFACIAGNATNVVLLYEARLTGVQTTAGQVTIQLLKRSTADTGSSNSMTAVPDDRLYPSASTTPVNYTSNPTTGTLVGLMDTAVIGFMAPATASPNDIYIGNWRTKPLVLRGTADEVCFNLNGVTVTGGTVDVTFKWFEVANLAQFTP